ncbi:type IV secretion system protein [Erwinia papayae]|uniref:Type IV secretion system protein n=1 Tax=Erwinia papayae TaxID=206499 RepID=A0ABV3N881_9GAMM
MSVEIVQPIFTAIDNSLQGTLVTGTANFMKGVSLVFGAFWIIYILMESLTWYFKGMTVAIYEFFRDCGKVVFITFFAIGLQPYMNMVVPFVTNAPGEITQLLTGVSGGSTNQIDVLINAFISTAIKIAGSLNFNIFTSQISSIVAGVACFILFLLGGFAFLGVCVATLIVLKICTTVFLAIGPLFIMFALFKKTEQYFWGWINLVGGFVLTNILFGVVVALEINYINNNVISDSGLLKADWISVLSMPLIFGAFAAVAQVIPNYAAQVMSGSPVGDGGGIRSMLGSNMAGIKAGMQMGKGIGRVSSRIRKNRIA